MDAKLSSGRRQTSSTLCGLIGTSSVLDVGSETHAMFSQLYLSVLAARRCGTHYEAGFCEGLRWQRKGNSWERLEKIGSCLRTPKKL